MIKPDDPELYKVAKKMAQANQGDTAKIYQKLGGSFSSDKRLKASKNDYVDEKLFNVNEATFAPSWESAKLQPKSDEDSDPKLDLKKGKSLLKKVYGGGMPSSQKKESKPVKMKPAIGDPELEEYSNPKIVQQRAFKIFGKDARVYRSTKKDKKYTIINPAGNPVHFGQLPYEDFTKHGDAVRRQNYLNRATNIKGNWKDDPYSPNNLAIRLLW